MEYIELAYRLLDSDTESVKDGDLLAMWARDQSEPQTHICVYEQAGEDISSDGQRVALHLDEVFREDADVVEREYMNQKGITPDVTDADGPFGQMVR